MNRIIPAVILLAALSHGLARANVVFDSMPSPPRVNDPGVGYQSSDTTEFGDAISLGGTARSLTRATVLLSNWAVESDNEAIGRSGGYYALLTLNLYEPGSTGPNPVVGTVLASSTMYAFIPWRPEATPGCGTEFGSFPDCSSGLSVPVRFTFHDEALPDEVIFGLSFNTATRGGAPTGHPGPYNSLNFVAQAGAPSTGTDINPDGVERNSGFGPSLTQPELGDAGIFGPEAGTIADVPAITLEAIPEPDGLPLLVPAILGLIAARRMRGRF